MGSLRIASPCSESWDAMRAVKGGRFCDACGRQVHDLTRMTAARAHAYALVFGGSGLCARMRTDEAGEPLFRPGPAPPRRTARAALPLVAAASLGSACAKGEAAAVPPPACAPTATIAALGPATSLARSEAPPSAADEIAAPSSAQQGEPRRVIVTTSGDLHILQHPKFRPAQAAIDAVNQPLLDEVAKLLQANPQIHSLDVEGHADDRERNPDGLGLARANAVVAYLASHGVSPSILRPRSAGASKPLADNQTAEGRERNRRVEFHIVEP